MPSGASLTRLEPQSRGRLSRARPVQHLEFKGQGMVVAGFEALMSDLKVLLPASVFKAYSADANP
jgi:dGTPase